MCRIHQRRRITANFRALQRFVQAAGVSGEKILFLAGLVTLPLSSAFAADLPARLYTKAPPPNSLLDWSGGYVGLSAGGAFGRSNQTDQPLGNPGGGGGGGTGGAGDGSYSVSGGLVGGTIGHNWQTGRWVYGFEGDYSWADISGHSDICGPMTIAPHPCGTKLSSLGTLRGRLGYAVGASGTWLLYGTAGAAVGEVRGWDSLRPASGGELRPGWTVGAGVETVVAPDWTVKVEYLYVDLGKAKLFDTFPAIPETVSFNANIIRAGVNYRLPPAQGTGTGSSWTPARNWAGLYVGGHAGGGSSRSDWMFQQLDDWWTGGSHAFPFPSKTGFLGGVQAGFNYQLGSVVAGVEGTWSGADLKTTILSPDYPDTDSQTTKVRNLFTFAARFGVTWDRVLFYGKGGWAGGEVELSAFSTSGGPTTWTPGSKFRSGVVVGGGVEYQITPNWIAGIEYNHIDLGRASYAAFDVGSDTSFSAVDDKTKIDTVVARVSYKFDGLGGAFFR